MTGTTKRSSQQLPVEPGLGDDPPVPVTWREPWALVRSERHVRGLHLEAPLQPASISYKDWPAAVSGLRQPAHLSQQPASTQLGDRWQQVNCQPSNSPERPQRKLWLQY